MLKSNKNMRRPFFLWHSFLLSVLYFFPQHMPTSKTVRAKRYKLYSNNNVVNARRA